MMEIKMRLVSDLLTLRLQAVKFQITDQSKQNKLGGVDSWMELRKVDAGLRQREINSGAQTLLSQTCTQCMTMSICQMSQITVNKRNMEAKLSLFSQPSTGKGLVFFPSQLYTKTQMTSSAYGQRVPLCSFSYAEVDNACVLTVKTAVTHLGAAIKSRNQFYFPVQNRGWHMSELYPSAKMVTHKTLFLFFLLIYISMVVNQKVCSRCFSVTNTLHH